MSESPHGRAARAQSFGAIAQDYHRYRPGPPDVALDWLLPALCRAVLDLGAGTGVLTRKLVERVPDVYAVEPDARMRGLLEASVPQVAVLAGRGEEIPLPDDSVDAVLVSAAWHWMDPELTVSEIARVLRPGGTFGLLWNSPDRDVAWVADLFRVGPESGEIDDQLVRRRRLEEIRLPEGSPFGPADITIIRWVHPTNPTDLRNLMGTYSLVVTLPAPEREELLDRVSDFIRTRLETTGRTEIALPMACRCWRATRL